MNYRGYTYDVDIHEEDDNRKMWHMIIRPDGKEVPFEMLPSEFKNISPYRQATQTEFEKAVDEVAFRDFTLGVTDVVNTAQGERI